MSYSDGAMLTKFLIQFSVEGWGCVPSLLFDLGQTKVEVMKIMATPSKGHMHPLLHSVSPTLQQAIADPRLCQRLLYTQGQVWVSLLWGHCSFLLGPGVNKVLVVPCRSLFPQFCLSSGSSMWVNGDLLQEGVCHIQICSTQSPCPCDSPQGPYPHR